MNEFQRICESRRSNNTCVSNFCESVIMFSSGRDHSMLHTGCQFYQLTEAHHVHICITPPLICPLIYGHINFTPNQCLCIKIKIKRSVVLNFEIVWAYRVIYFLVKSRFFDIKCILWAKIILYKVGFPNVCM